MNLNLRTYSQYRAFGLNHDQACGAIYAQWLFVQNMLDGGSVI